MENLLPIGRFSDVCRLSIKALRLYDELGLLHPARVDASSGYRYYTYTQANRAEAIRVLRSLDMPLDDIREALAGDDPTAVLERHRVRLEAELDRRTRMLSYLRRLIERKEGVMPYEITVKELPSQHVATLTRRTSAATLGEDVGGCFAAVGAALGAAGVPPVGPPYLVMPDVIDQETPGRIVVGFPVAVPFPGNGEVVGEEAPAMTVASTVHRGPYEEVRPAYHTLQGWIQEHGHQVTGPLREIYLTDPNCTPDPADYVTEVQYPIG
ncbi:MAG: MerR family transcriptional regulator [Actinomycetales bacterium]|nr:MerR family transcriptional regulator [Actinomycetales bacterium]